MDLPEDLKNAAQELGSVLSTIPCILAYKTAKSQADSDPQVVELERRLGTMYQELSNREMSGETLPRLEVNAYYSLKYQVSSHPTITNRDAQFENVKITLARVSNDMSELLGLDYPDLVLP